VNCVHGSFHGMGAVLLLLLAKSRMKSAASALIKSALTATRHVARAVGQGGRAGIKNATKELVKEHALKHGRAFLREEVAPLARSGASQFYPPQMYGMLGVSPAAQKFPASCECDYFAAAPVSPSGKKILTCHSCAPKGMGARNFQVALEAVLPSKPRGRQPAARFRNFFNATKKSSGSKGSRGRSLPGHSRSKRTQGASRARSEGRTRSKSKK